MIKKVTPKEHEWLEATYNVDPTVYENRNDDRTVRVRVSIGKDTTIDDVLDAVYGAIPGDFDLEKAPNLEVLRIVDEDGCRILGEDETHAMECLDDSGESYRVLPCARYHLSPEAILHVTLDEHGVKMDFETATAVFKDFMAAMERHGYASYLDEGSLEVLDDVEETEEN